jgi:hypothetical protein
MYREMLINRARYAERAQPHQPEQPLTYVQYMNKLATKRWREKMEKANDDPE